MTTISEVAAKDIMSAIHRKAESLGSANGRTPLNARHVEQLESRLAVIAARAIIRHDPARTPLVPFVKAMVNRSAPREAAREFNAQLKNEESTWGDDSLDRPIGDQGEESAETTLVDLIAEDVETIMRRKTQQAVREVLRKMDWTEQLALSSLMYTDRTSEYCASRLGISRPTFQAFRDNVAVPHFIALWHGDR